jgi:hypothetical protein
MEKLFKLERDLARFRKTALGKYLDGFANWLRDEITVMIANTGLWIGLNMYKTSIIAWLTFAVVIPARAQNLDATPRTRVPDCRLSAPHPSLAPRRVELSLEEQLGPWLHDCQRRIRRMLEKESLMPFSCTFNFDSNGQVCAFKIVESSGLPTYDQKILNAVRDAKLLEIHPENRSALVRDRGILLQITDNPLSGVQVSLAPKK